MNITKVKKYLHNDWIYHHPLKLPLILLFVFGSTIKGWGQTITWSNTAALTPWYTNTNWSPNTASNAWTTSNVAQFGNTGTATTAGIDMSTKSLSIGAIEVTNARTRSLTIGNSSASANTGSLTLNGATVNGISRTIIRNSSSSGLTLQNNETGSSNTMGIVLGNTTDNVVNVDGAGNVTISSSISGTNRQLTVNTNSTGSLILSGVNSYSGGTTIYGTNTGQLQINTVGALPTTGTVTVNTGGGLRFNAVGTHGATNQSFVFNPDQVINPSLDIGNGAVTLQGNLTLNADTRIEANGGSAILTLPGNISGIGMLQKQANGSLVLSGTNNTYSGGTRLGNGSITVNNGSSIGTGPLIMFQVGANTNFNLNNTAQTISSLSSTFLVSTGTFSQTINLGSGHTLTVNQSINTSYGDGAVSTLTSVIAGSGNFVKSGSGTLTFNGVSVHSYTGSTTINGGILSVTTLKNGGVNSGIGASTNAASNLVLSGGTLQYTGAAQSIDRNFTFGNATNASGATIDGSGTGALTISGSMTSVNIASSTQTLTLAGTSVGNTISGALVNGTGSALTALSVTGSGSWILTGANTFTGGVTVSAGTLQLNRTGGTTIPSTNNISVASSGTLKVSSSQTIANLDLSGGGNLIVDAGTTLTITGTYTPGNGTITNNGIINLNSSGTNFPGAFTTIAAMNNLQISGNITLNKSIAISGALTLSSGKLSIGSNTLTLNGTFSGTASSNLVGSATSNITIGGSSAVGTLRFDQTTNGTTNVLNNLVVNNSYTSGAAVSLGDSLKLVGTLTPSAGQLATGGYLTLLSTNEYNSAAIGAATGNTFTTNYITGNVTTQRYSQAQRGYRAVGHPFASTQPLSILTDNIRITGLTDMPASPTAPQYGTSAGNPSAFLYNPTATAGSLAALTRLTSGLTTVWPKAQGLYLFIRGAGNQGASGAGSSNYASNALTATVLDVIGAINQGDVTYDLVYGGVGKDNYNLVGNPYPSTINLKNVSNIPNGTIYVYNPIKNYGTVPDAYNVVGGFDSYTYTNGSSDVIIPAMGAFYVLTTANTTITFHESDKVSASAPTYNVFGTPKQPKFSVKVATPDGDVDDLKFGFSADATAASGDTYDAAKLSNSLFDLYSISSNKAKLTVDYRDLASLASTIPLGISTNAARNYTISLASIQDLPNTQLVLRDKFLKTETILSQVGDSYSFDITADTATKGDNRFEIGLLGTTVLPVQIADITAQLQANKTVAVSWISTTEVNLAKYNVQRSKDGSNFTTVGTVAAKGASAYNYNDDLSTAGVLPSTIYYRLEALDKDGSKTYSKVVVVALGSNLAKAAINIYPNPVQATLFAQVTVTKAGAAQLRVIDAQGKVVATQKTQLAVGTTSVSIPAAQLTAGNYVLEIDSADGKQTQRFVKE